MLSRDFIAKIEGHGDLKTDWRNNTVKLHVYEGERLFEGILVGRTVEEAHWITPRICGVCPIAHNLASLSATEDAYGIKISELDTLLRRLMAIAQVIQSHVLHLFFLALPDYIGLDRGTDLLSKDPKAFKKALSLKDLGDEIATIIAGRNVHPTTTTVGGFHKLPKKNELEKILKKLGETKKAAEWTVKLFSGLKYPDINVDFDLVALVGDQIISSKNGSASIKDYKKNIEEEIRSDSTAKFAKFQGRDMMVGALARLKIKEIRGEEFKNRLIKKSIKKINFDNLFYNNFAQAIEILAVHEEAEEIIKKLLNTEFVHDIAKPGEKSDFAGIGAVEAPRGGLYHEIRLDKNGIINYANIITPTVQNLSSIEKSAQALLDKNADKSREERERLLHMLIRAYDPCLSCSVH